MAHMAVEVKLGDLLEIKETIHILKEMLDDNRIIKVVRTEYQERLEEIWEGVEVKNKVWESMKVKNEDEVKTI